MEQPLEQRIMEYIRNRQPVKQVTLLSELNIDRESYYAATMLLRKERKIITTSRGIFAGDEGLLMWKKQGG
ncbi:hypothetical protein ID80_004858 [Salmonella enterica subsp. enterica serovar Ball]|nr:hypothetical protein [Salmonella enterica subsp. enterica serovar Minnesota]EDV5024170.1 hypothetical protein [Salmonella enterica subsp. enterica serovar Ball]